MRRIAQIYAERHPELRTRNEARAAELERSAVILRGMLARGVQG